MENNNYKRKSKRELIDLLQKRDGKIIILNKKLIKYEERINQLEKRLLAYENAHTPPSKQRFKKKD